MSTELCASCSEPLLVEVPLDSDDEDQVIIASASAKGRATPQFVIDDVELNCGCHFHWECFLDSPTITQCPSCERNISTLNPTNQTQQQVLVTVRNEGGVQENYDILPSATEEAYLRTYPEERRGHAFLEFVREGDIDALVCLIREDREDGEDDDEEEEVVEKEGNVLDVLRYTGTFEGIEGSALHVAVRYEREEIAWLLLALGSGLAWEEFPKGSVEVLNGLGLGVEDRQAVPDIRGLKDAEGRLPVDLAKEVGGVWTKWIEAGKLNP